MKRQVKKINKLAIGSRGRKEEIISCYSNLSFFPVFCRIQGSESNAASPSLED